MANPSKPITVVTLDSEEAYFRKREEEKIRSLRERSQQEEGASYAEEHRNHCFRCGTPTLVEVDQGKVKIDLCVNEGCGAVHLGPGELDALVSDQAVVQRIRKAVFACFK